MIRLVEVSKSFPVAGSRIPVLKDVSLEVSDGEMVALIGASGSGKSTLMNILGGLDRPTSGQYWLAGQDVSDLDPFNWATVRNQHIGFVFQSFNLIPTLTVLENAELPLVYRGMSPGERRRRAAQLLTQMGLGKHLTLRPPQLSGGQQQRVAISRALVGEPTLLLADEPTGNLDSTTSGEMLELFHRIHENGQTIVLVTHDPAVAASCERIIEIKDGQIGAGTGVSA